MAWFSHITTIADCRIKSGLYTCRKDLKLMFASMFLSCPGIEVRVNV